VILDGGGANPNDAGVETGAGRINKHQTGAIDVENSNHITIRGWQMSGSGSSSQPNWVTLDPSVTNWAVGGVRFFGVTNSVIDHNAFNNDTDNSVSLFNSSNNTVTNNAANVTASGGGVGVANLNGNVWSGNVTKTIDPCIPAQ
jgi:parallel beta-helix repeat protein